MRATRGPVEAASEPAQCVGSASGSTQAEIYAHPNLPAMIASERRPWSALPTITSA
jgi:hypothetical protein